METILEVLIFIAILPYGIFSLLAIHTVANFFVLLLGKEKCISTDSINGCNCWPISIILSVIIIVFTKKHLGDWSLALIPTGPLIVAFLIAIQLRLGGWQERKIEFFFCDGHIKDRAGNIIEPVYVKTSGGYYCTGPASGYCLYALILCDASSTLCTNRYVSREEKDRVLRQLYDEYRLYGFDLTFEWRKSDKETRHIRFGQDWLDMFCRDITRLPAPDQSFWQQFLQPAFGLNGHITIKPYELMPRLETLESTYADQIETNERLQHDCLALRNLIEMTQDHLIHIETSDVQSEYSESVEELVTRRTESRILCGSQLLKEIKIVLQAGNHSLNLENTTNEEIWCVVANVVREREVDGETKIGTRQFRGGAKVCIIGCYPGTCSDVIAVGLHRKSRRMITCVIRVTHVENFRAKRVYNPKVLEIIENDPRATITTELRARDYVDAFQEWQKEAN